MHPAHDEHRLAGAGLIGAFNKRHRHRNLTITVLFARVPTYIAAAPRWSPILPRPCVAATPIARRAPTLHLEPRWRPPETVGLFAREWVF